MSEQEYRLPTSPSSSQQAAENLSSSSSPVEVEHKQSFSETMKQYQETIQKIIDHGIELGQETDPIRNLDQGEIDGVKYQVVFRSGKQQPVRILHFTFPNGVNGEAVFRQAWNIPRIENFYQTKAVKDIFPEIYLSHKGVLVLECIQGLEEKRTGEGFNKHIEDPQKFRQLIDDSFEMIDALLESGLTLHDIGPAGGHNIIFDINALKYRFFDVGTLYPRGHESAAEDFFYITDDISGHSGDKQDTLFWLELIKKYREKYPQAAVYREGEAYEIWQVDRLNSMEEADQYPPEYRVMPDDPSYEDYYKAVHWRGAYIQGQKDKWMPLHKYPQMKREVTYTDEEFLTACEKGDFELAESILNRNKRKIVLTKSVVVDQEKR